MTAEELANVLGKPGKFQFILYIMLTLNYTYVCWSHLGMVFIGAKTKHHCQVENKTDIPRLVPLVEKGGKKQWDECHLYAGYNTSEKISCPNGWTYSQSDRERTVVAEWDLVCDNAYKKNLATTLYFCGVMLGGLVFGTLSDKFGRRPILLFTMYSPSVIGLLVFFFQNYVAFVILRFILGFLLQGLQMASFISFMEVFAIQYRTVAGIFVGVFWSTGVMSLALISYLIQDWQYIQLFCTLAGLLQLGLLCFLPESFRWLVIKNRVDEAERVVKRIATFNKLPFPREVFEKATKNNVMDNKVSKPGENYTIIDVFRISVLRKRSFILAMVWFSTSLGYYGLALNTSSLAGNKYLNFFISGLLELIICVVTAFVVNRFSRRKPLCLYSIIGGITCITAGVLSSMSLSKSLQNITTVLAIFGRTFTSGCFAVLFIYTAELYPTVIRNVGLGAGIFWTRIGGILAPQILLLGKYSANAVPFVILGTCVLVSGILCLFLPETLNMKLAETIEEAGNSQKMTRGCVVIDSLNKNSNGLSNNAANLLENDDSQL